MKISVMVATAALMLAATSGCGDDSSSKKADAPDKAVAASSSIYCAQIEKAAEEYFGPDSADMVDPRAAFDAIILIAKSAPKAVNAEWNQMGDAVDAMLSTLDEIGISFADLDSLFEGKSPRGADIDAEEALAALEPVLAAVSAPEFLAAQEKVQAHAKSECKVDLLVGLGSAVS